MYYIVDTIFVNPSCPGGVGGTLCPQGQSPDHLGFIDKAMNLKFYDFSSNSIWDKGRTKKIYRSSTFCAPGLLSGTGETHRLSVMCQLGLGFCNFKKLFGSNVLFPFTG